MVSRKAAGKILRTYGKAWTAKDTKLILSIFTRDATYSERWYEPKYKGHGGIANYWDTKVVNGQSKIRFKVLNYWTVGNTIIAEWEAWFHNEVKKKNRHLREVGIFEMKGGKVRSFREIWHKQK